MRKKEVDNQLDPDMGGTKKNCLCVECVTCNRKCDF